MPLNKTRGNMYPWVDFTWNPIRGKCPHLCSYCYMKKFPVGELRLEKKELNLDLGLDRNIFVGSSTDMFAEGVNQDWILAVLNHCQRYPYNRYLFQSKNPDGMNKVLGYFPKRTILGTTIETNREYCGGYSSAPFKIYRVQALEGILLRKMVSIEPIMDFDIDELIEMIQRIKPKFISIGADSQGNNLPEPEPKKVKELIMRCELFTEVKIKSNLKRIIERKE